MPAPGDRARIASISDYDGTASGMLIQIDFEEELGCLWDLQFTLSSFQHRFSDEEGSELPVQTEGKASYGAHPVEISASSTWMLAGAQAGQKLAFKASGPIANQGELTTSYYVNDLTHSQSQGRRCLQCGRDGRRWLDALEFGSS